MFTEIGTYQYREEQRGRFKSGELIEEWYKTYPDIFDEEDLRIAEHQSRYHFFEWLAAIIIFQTYGFLSLVEQYEFKKHKRKQDILRGILDPDLFDLVTNRKGRSPLVQCPDLFCYSRDWSDWFFCEVKGPNDSFKEAPTAFFNELSRRSQNPVRVIKFKCA